VCVDIYLYYQLHFGKEGVGFVVIVPVFNQVFEHFFIVQTPGSILCVCVCSSSLVCRVNARVMYIICIHVWICTYPVELLKKLVGLNIQLVLRLRHSPAVSSLFSSLALSFSTPPVPSISNSGQTRKRGAQAVPYRRSRLNYSSH
jgi:hypothetical protein